MAGEVSSRGLTEEGSGRRAVAFSRATRSDEPAIRRLLAETAMDGWIQLALAREPDAFAAHRALGHAGDFIVGRDARSGEVMGVGERTLEQVFLNGAPVDIVYLAALRVRDARRRAIRALGEGFQLARSMARARAEPSLSFTVIAKDNARAQRLLTARLPGMPVYTPAGEIVTLAIAARSRRASGTTRPLGPTEFGDLAAGLASHGRTRQFAPVWSPPRLRRVLAQGALSTADILVAEEGPRHGSIAVWDQRGFKQVRVAGYAPLVRRTRPLLNVLSRFTGAIRLPPPGAQFDQVFLSLFACPPDDSQLAVRLVGDALALASAKGADLALLGLDSRNPLVGALESRFGARRYLTRVYFVSWPDDAPPAVLPAGSLVEPDIALL